MSTVKSNLPDIASLTSGAADYHVEYWTESSSPEGDTFNKTSGYSSKITGFFAAPQADNYTFYIRSDDKSELYLSLTGDPANKVPPIQQHLIGFCSLFILTRRTKLQYKDLRII